MNTIYLAATQRHVGAPAYIEGYRRAKANPTAVFESGLTTWWAVTGAEIVAQYRLDLHRRINARGGEAWRNERTIRDSDYLLDAIDANTPRRIIRRFRIPKLNRRLAHRLFSED